MVPGRDKPAPAALPGPAATAVGEDVLVTGLDRPWAGAWSPSGRRVVLCSGRLTYLLDLAEPSLERIPSVGPWEPVFWSETELFWMDENGRVLLRNLETGDDRLIHDLQVLIETGHLIGRMASGQVLAVEGRREGPLWALTPTGEKRLVSRDDAHFVQLSPDGGRALWFTGGPEPAYDPPLTDLWTWDGAGDPVRIPLGGAYSAWAQFSPDGQRIALALNEEIRTELAPGEERQPRPGHLAVVEGGRIRVPATFEGRVGIDMWLGNDSFRFTRPSENTGAQPPIPRMDLSGGQSVVDGLWYHPQIYPAPHHPDRGPNMLVIWRDDVATVYWSDSERVAQVSLNGDVHGQPLYAPPWAAYRPVGDSDSLRFLRFAPPGNQEP